MKLNEYRLNSLEEPSDELLRQLMEQVAISFRESSHRVENEKRRRLREVAEEIKNGGNRNNLYRNYDRKETHFMHCSGA